MSLHIKFDGEQELISAKSGVDIIELDKNRISFIIDHKTYSAELIGYDSETKKMEIQMNNKRYEATVESDTDLLLKKLGFERSSSNTVSKIVAPMPGLVLNMVLKPGDSFEVGDPLLVLEAMKMENIIKAPAAGIIEANLVNSGDKVIKNQILIKIGPKK